MNHATTTLSIDPSTTTDATDTPEPTNPETAAIHVRATRTCSSLSGSCTLEYQIGSNAQSECFLRITHSTGNGVYNRDWYAFKDIAGELAKLPPKSMVVAKSLRELCAGKSSVTPGFVMAVLVHMGLLRAIAQLAPDDAQDGDLPASPKAQYELGDTQEFNAAMAVLLQMPQGIAVLETSADPTQEGKTKAKGRKAAH